MPVRRVLAALTVVVLTLTACGGSEPEEETTDADPTEGTVALDEGVAATVDGTEIPADLLEARLANAEDTPQISQLLEGEQADAVRRQLASTILSQLIVNEIVVNGAEEMGLEVDEEAIETTREELVTEAGGEDVFVEQVSAAGLDEEQLAAELESITALRLVREELTGEEAPAPGPQATASPSEDEAALQQWLLEHIQAAEVQVDPEIGSWDPNQGAVVPAGGGLQAPPPGGAGAPPAPPEEGSTAPGEDTSDGQDGEPAEPTEPAASPAS